MKKTSQTLTRDNNEKLDRSINKKLSKLSEKLIKKNKISWLLVEKILWPIFERKNWKIDKNWGYYGKNVKLPEENQVDRRWSRDWDKTFCLLLRKSSKLDKNEKLGFFECIC